MSYKIYGKDSCPYCEKAKVLLREHDVSYEYVNISYDDSARTFLKQQGFRTVPQIWKDGEYVGGYTELLDSLI